MDLQTVIQTVETRLGPMQRVRDEVFKAERRHENSLFAYYLFDCTGALFREDFNLPEYQDELLAGPYYENPGPLQWNLYLYFVCDDEPFARLSGSDKLVGIETDLVYARKRVLRQSELEAELDRLIQSKLPTADGLGADVAGRWREQLREQGLDAVFLDVPYTQTVERFLSGDPIRDDSEGGGTSTCHVANLPQIDALTLHTYRPFPEQRDFVFGKANLITGANGTGKTSLLEALELWICGEAFRTRSAPDIEPRIGLRFDGETESLWNRATTAEYRARDQAWYGNHYRKGNHLCEGFNRFNLFNSDAAAALVLRDDAAGVHDALAALVLGEEAGLLYSRLEALLPRFQQEERNLTREVRRLRDEEEEVKSQLRAAEQATGEQQEQARESFLRSLSAVSWRGSTPEQDGSLPDDFVAQLHTIEASVEQIRRLTGVFPADSTLSGVQELQRDAVAWCDQWQATEAPWATARTRKSELLAMVREDDKTLKRLQRLLVYTTHSEANSLLGIGDLISEKRRECDQYKSGSAAVAGFSLDPYANNTVGLDEEIRSHEDRLASLQHDRDELERIVQRMQESHGRLAALVAEIRTRASALVEEQPDVRECPVCRAQYEIGELALIMQSEIEEQEDAPGLQAQTKKLATIEAQLEKMQQELARLRLLERARSLLPDSIRADLRTLAGLVNRIQASRAVQDALEGELTRLQGLSDRLGREGFTEEELSELRTWSVASYPVLGVEPSRPAELSDLIRQIEEAKRVRLEEIDQVQGSLDTLTAQRQKIRRRARLDPQPELDDEAAQEALQHKAGRLSEATGAISRMTELLSVKSDVELDAVLHTAATLQVIAEGYSKAVREAQERQQERVATATKLSRVEQELEKLLPRSERAQLALATLQNIYDNDSKEQNLAEAMKRHAAEITAVFQCLHSPREFNTVSFIDGLKLIRASGIAEPLTHISTGQRTALAISIFLAMNRQLLNGPRLLLFDDPVAHVDDLNILSFLDYLREVTLQGERQVFFTTANRRVANLFKKKFAFLCDNLQTYALERAY